VHREVDLIHGCTVSIQLAHFPMEEMVPILALPLVVLILISR